MAKKAADEKSLQEFVNSDPQRKQEFGDPWAAIAKAVDVQKQIYKPLFYLDGHGRIPRRSGCVRSAHRARRLREAEAEQPAHALIIRTRNCRTLQQRLYSTAPVYKNLEQV